MKLPLDLIEARLQTFIEGSLAALLPRGNTKTLLAHQLVEAMQNNLHSHPDGSLVAPSLYVIQVNPARLAYWQTNPVYLEQLAQTLYLAGKESGLVFDAQPAIRVDAEPTLPAAEIRILASGIHEEISHTAVMEVEPVRRVDSAHIPRDAYLIVNGAQVFPLSMPVVSIGRRSDNHIILDDPRVSRTHAQLRAINGQFVVFDLNSTGGTFVNGARIQTAGLAPGDVISLAGVPVIYGEDTPPSQPDPLDQTRSMDVHPSEEPGPPGDPSGNKPL